MDLLMCLGVMVGPGEDAGLGDMAALGLGEGEEFLRSKLLPAIN